MIFDKGYIHLYTGNGKGKTSAATGMAIRCAGARGKVFIAQFVKGMPYHENVILSGIPGIECRQFGRGCFIVREPQAEDIKAAQKGLKHISGLINTELYDMIILDEICIALHYKLIGINELIMLLHSRHPSIEIVLTGRYAPPQLFEISDVITVMDERKHYYTQKITARKGIEF